MNNKDSIKSDNFSQELVDVCNKYNIFDIITTALLNNKTSPIEIEKWLLDNDLADKRDNIKEIIKNADVDDVMETVTDLYSTKTIIDYLDIYDVIDCYDEYDILDIVETWSSIDDIKETEYSKGYSNALDDVKNEYQNEINSKQIDISDLWVKLCDIEGIPYYDNKQVYAKLNDCINKLNNDCIYKDNEKWKLVKDYDRMQQ